MQRVLRRSNVLCVVDRDIRMRWHALEESEERGIRRAERDMAQVESEMEHDTESFEREAARAKHDIEREWRDEHFGHDPERPPQWRNNDP